MSHPLVRYEKRALSLSGQLSELESLGIGMPSVELVLDALRRIGYGRILLYVQALREMRDPGLDFGRVIQLYDFDRQLRLHCMDAIERIEIALRAAITHTLAVDLNPHFYLESRHYERHASMLEFTSRAVQARSPTASRYVEVYNSPSFPPIWTILDSVTLGTLSRLFSGLHLAHRKRVASQFGLDEKILVSWFRSITDVRNIAAHHGRLWNAAMHINMPVKASEVARIWPTGPAASKSFAARAIVFVSLTRHIDPTSTWAARFRELSYPQGSIVDGAMGFPTGWRDDPFWY